MNIEEKTYQKITPATEGNYLTTYREGDDIKTYEGVKAMYTPADFDASTGATSKLPKSQRTGFARGNGIKTETLIW